MNILLLAENWPPRQGGIENYLTHIASLLPTGSVTVVAPTTAEAQLHQEFGSGITRVIRKRFFWPFLKPAWLPLLFFVRKLVKQESIDMILCGKTLFEGLLAYHVHKTLGTPYIVFTYGMEIEVWAKKNKANVTKVLQKANRVVYINEQTKKTLIALGVQDHQLIKIWPGIHENWFSSIDEQVKAAILKKYNLSRPFILTGARLIQRKGIDTVIEAFKKLQSSHPNLTLAIFGTGPEEKSLKELASQSASISFLGNVTANDLPALYSASEFYVLSPKELEEDIEGFGIVYIEAAAQGKAVIGALTGGVPEAVIHKETGILIQPNNSAAAAEAMQLLLSDTSLRNTLGENGRKRAYAEFRWSKRILLVKGMLDAVMAEKIISKQRQK